MRPGKHVVVAVAVAVLAVSGAITFTASGRDELHPHAGRIEITGTILRYARIPSGPLGRNSNTTEQLWRLNDRAGHEIGRMAVWCRWVRDPWRLCVGEAKLPLGEITWQGATNPPLIGEVAVTGGTGRYQGASGSVRFTAVAPNKIVLSFRLS